MPIAAPFPKTAALVLAAGLACAATAASAHPHVWVTARAELIYDGDKVRAVQFSAAGMMTPSDFFFAPHFTASRR